MSYESYPEGTALQVAHKIFHYKKDGSDPAALKKLETKLAGLMANADEKSKKIASRLASIKVAKDVVVKKEEK